MEIASSATGSIEDGVVATRTTRGTNVLPSLFNRNTTSVAAGKDLEGLMTMNDSTLSQQIEFILQDAPMEPDDNNGLVTRNNTDTAAVTATIKLENPPTTIVTSASEYRNHNTGDTRLALNSQATQAHILNGRRIIIQPTPAPALGQMDDDDEDEEDDDEDEDDDDDDDEDEDEEEDPELNDENLQDIEEEAQAAEDEDEDEETHEFKLEPEEDDEPMHDEMEYINTATIGNHATLSTQPPQLVLPAGSIVTTNARALTVPVSEALVQLQRRPVYISNAVGSLQGATFVRMPAVISRSPMTVLNVVQQGLPVGAPTTQLILQATPVSSSATPVMVTTTSGGMAAQAVTAVPISELTVASAAPTATVVVATSTAPSALLSSNAILTHTGQIVAQPVLTTSSIVNNSLQATNLSNMTTTTYQCLECVEKFDSKELFDIHRSGHANNMKCAICNMVLKSLKNYEKHCLRCKPYECQICGRVVRFRPNFIKHMRVHTGQQSERHKYKCDVCHKEFMSFEYFKVHKKIHNENVNLTCEICGKVFSALASLRGHSKLHSGVKLHKCDVCGKGFGQRYNLKIHARTHTGDFPFECKICKKKLHTQSSLQTHMQIHQRDQTSQVTTTIKYESSGVALNNSNISNGNGGASSTTIIKLEPQNDRPSTSGFLNQHQDDYDDNSGLSEGCLLGTRIVTGNRKTRNRNAHLTTGEDSSNESSNTSHELQQQHQQQQQQQQQLQQRQQNQTQQLLVTTPTRTIVIKNYVTNDQNLNSGIIGQQHTQVIQGNNNTLQQQLLRKTPIIHSTGGATTLSSALASVVHQSGTSPSLSPSSSSTSCSSSVVVSKSGAPLSLASAAIGTSTIRSTRNHHHSNSSLQLSSNHRALQRNNHRNHHRRRHPTSLDDDDEDDDDNSTNLHHTSVNGRHFDDDDDDEKSSPSLAATAMIKVEPNLYSSGSGDNSNDMLIKEEVMFEDSAAPHSPHSPPSSKFRISNFDNDLVDHHVDLNHSLPPYGNLFEPHSIPDSIPVQLYPDDDDDFRLDHSSLGGLHNTSSSTNDGDFIKKEWSYGTSSGYSMNGKFEDDNDALCDAANFISYN